MTDPIEVSPDPNPAASPPEVRGPWAARVLALPLLLLGFGIAGGLLLSPTLGDLGGDSAQYLMLAEALGGGRGYVDLHLPGHPLHGHYPPGLALLLAPLVAVLGPGSFVAIKLFLLGLAVVALGLWFRFLAGRGSRAHALCALFLCVGSGNLLGAAVRVQSELPYMLATALALTALEHPRGRAGLQAGLATAAAFLLRIAGIALVLAFLVEAWRGRARRPLLATTTVLAPVLVWGLWAGFVARGTWGYGAELLHSTGGVLGLPAHLCHGLGLQCLQLGRLSGDSPWTSSSPALQVLLCTLILTGIGARLRRGRRPAETFWLVSLVLSALAPRPLERYLLPLLPLSSLYLVEGTVLVGTGLARLVSLVTRNIEGLRCSPERAAGVVLILPLALGLTHVQATTHLLQLRHREALVPPPPMLSDELDAVDMAQWEEGWIFGDPMRVGAIRRAYADWLMACRRCRSLLPADAVLTARKPRVVAFLTGRSCVPLPPGDTTLALARLRTQGVTHLLSEGLFPETRDFVRAVGKRIGLVPVDSVRSSVLFALVPFQGHGTEDPSPPRPR